MKWWDRKEVGHRASLQAIPAQNLIHFWVNFVPLTAKPGRLNDLYCCGLVRMILGFRDSTFWEPRCGFVVFSWHCQLIGGRLKSQACCSFLWQFSVQSWYCPCFVFCISYFVLQSWYCQFIAARFSIVCQLPVVGKRSRSLSTTKLWKELLRKPVRFISSRQMPRREICGITR